MKKNKLAKIFLLIAAIVYNVFFKFDLSAQSNFVPPASPELIAEVNQQDSMLFLAAFDHCDISVLQEMVADDLEFLHDKWGVVANSGAQFIAGVASNCRDQKEGRSNPATRKINPSSVEVYPLRNIGAIHKGEHSFYQKIDGEYRFTEKAQFTHVWRKTEGGWKVARVLSYDHRPESEE